MNFHKKKLNNGITVIMEKRDLPVVSFSISNKFGAINENSEIKGIAHFIEHLLFTGTKTRTHEDISREIESKGGILNAYTANEVTSFWFKLPSEHLNAGMDILIDMLNNSIINEEKFEKEKKVILEEIKMYHDDPRTSVMDSIFHNLYENPFGLGIIGTSDTVSSLKRDFVYEFYKKVYNPSNFIVTIVGNTDFDAICEKIEKSFVGNNIKDEIVFIKKKNDNTREERDGIDQAHLVFGIHAPLANTPEHYTLQILNAYLAGGMSSKLFLEIREKRGLAYSVSGYLNTEKRYAYYVIYVGTRKDAIDEVKKLIIEGFDKAQKMTELELIEAKQRLIGLRKVESEESSSTLNLLLFEELCGGAEEYYNFEKMINSVKLEDVRKMAKLDKYSFAAIVPK